MSDDFERISSFYDELAAEHHTGPLALDYGSVASQLRRFAVLSQVVDFSGRRVLDVGCGLADYADYLQGRFADVEYEGIDLSPALIEHARERRPDLNLRVANVLDDEIEGPYDVVHALGIFYLLGDDAPEIMRRLIKRMWNLARVAVAISALSTWAPERYEQEFQADPAETLAFCRSLSPTPWIVLRHDYMPHDFTLFLYREQQS
jgi:SAM-dependent methyltransferase